MKTFMKPALRLPEGGAPTGTGMARPDDGTIGAFKGQPWIIYDTVASYDFRVNAPTNALATNGPAINNAGEMIFLNAQGRNRANWPWLTNLDLPGQLSYGFEAWAIAFELRMPLVSAAQSLDNTGPSGVGTALKLAECLLNYSVVELDLGQENQTAWPITSFGNGGGLWSFLYSVQNGMADVNCRLNLPEPIEMGRTQNFSIKVKLAPFNFATIGQGSASGVGMPLNPYIFQVTGGETPVDATVPQTPYGLVCKLIGRRIKNTQYGSSPA